MDLDQVATQSGFADLVGVTQPAIAKLVEKDVLRRGLSFRAWLESYCQNLRDQAAGRGASNQVQLNEAKIEESTVKTALNRLQYYEKIGELISAADCERVLREWASYSNREYSTGVDKLVAQIEAEHKVIVDPIMVKNIVSPTVERIQGFAEKLGDDLVEGCEDVQSTEKGVDD